MITKRQHERITKLLRRKWRVNDIADAVNVSCRTVEAIANGWEPEFCSRGRTPKNWKQEEPPKEEKTEIVLKTEDQAERCPICRNLVYGECLACYLAKLKDKHERYGKVKGREPFTLGVQLYGEARKRYQQLYAKKLEEAEKQLIKERQEIAERS